MCHVDNLKVARRPLPRDSQFLWSALNKVIDCLHLQNHKDPRCHQIYNPEKMKDNPGYNAMCCEQTFAWLSRFKKILAAMQKHTTTFTFTAWWRGGTNTSLFAMQMDVGLFSLSKVAIHALANFSFISELKFCFSCIHIVIFGRSVLACINIGYTLDSRWLRRLDHRGNRCIDVLSATSV